MSHSFLLPPGDYILLVATEEQKSTTSPSNSSHPLHSHQQKQQQQQQQSTRKSAPRAPPPPPSSSLFLETNDTEPGIWCHISSIGRIGLHHLSLEDEEILLLSDLHSYFHEMKNKYSLPLPEVWPLMMDHQHEVSSKGLIKILSQIRTDLNRVNVEYLNLKNKQYKNKLNNVPL